MVAVKGLSTFFPSFFPEFVVDPKSVITERIALYYQAIEIAEDEGKKTRVQTLQAGIQVKHLHWITPLVSVRSSGAAWSDLVVRVFSSCFCYLKTYLSKINDNLWCCYYILTMPQTLHKQDHNMLLSINHTPSLDK